ncbi:MAG: phosphoribosyltransferase family protein [Gemmataceae bacterium]|nr:phosphoribosyltransferase family protein [Gemmataceae bacterium]
MSEPLSVPLRAGTLSLWVERAEWPLEELCGFASRRSRKRGFVFVSKVLGKHYPVRPRVMEAVHGRLAEKLSELASPAVVVAMAETAVGLGQGVYEQLLRLMGGDELLFLHTTRYRLSRPLALTFEEGHSHATQHLLYEPANPDHLALFRSARSLVLVDDEISTGRTLANLAAAYRQLNPHLEAVHLVSITDWLAPQNRHEVMARAGVPVSFHSLLSGRFAFTPDADFDPGPIPNADGPGDCKDEHLAGTFGRLGRHGPVTLAFEPAVEALCLQAGQRLLVLGTGEFAHPPFLLAKWLDERGWDVHYQATTRSPLLVDTDLLSGLEFLDNYHDGIPNYLYNVADRHYDRIVLCYETHPLPAGHRLPELLGADCLFFAADGRLIVSARGRTDP